MSLVIQKLRLLLLATNVLELPSHSRVSKCNGESSTDVALSIRHKDSPDVHHAGVQDPQITLYGYISLAVHIDISLEHLISRDPHVVESKPPIVFSVVAKFGSDVSRFDTWQMLVSISVPDLNQKWSDTIVI